MTLLPRSSASGTALVIWRAVRILASVLWLTLYLLALVAPSRLVLGPQRAGSLLGVLLRRQLERLGPTFVKLGQLLSSRVDLLPAPTRAQLSLLHDRVRSPGRRSSLVPGRRTKDANATTSVASSPARKVASGSIADVYETWVAGAGHVALKVIREGIGERIAIDLRLLAAAGSVAARVPLLRTMPVIDVLEQISGCMAGQLDYRQEGTRLARLRSAVSQIGAVTVPAPFPELSTEDVLVSEFLPGLPAGRSVQPSEEARRKAVTLALRSLYQMLFVDGLVHCDLHPGNLYLRSDGGVVILDAGFMHEMTDEQRYAFADFFYCLGTGAGKDAAEIVLRTSAVVRPSAHDADAFRSDMRALVQRHHGVSAREFNLALFAAQLFNLQRRHGIRPAPDFVLPIIALLVLEGSIGTHHPDLDFQREAMPFLARALFMTKSTTARPR